MTITTEHPPTPTTDDEAQARRIERAIARHSFAVLSTVSAAGHPHAAGVSYASVSTTMYVHTSRASRKARNIAAESRVALVIPVRRIPIGPPFNVQLQGRATLLAMDAPEIAAHLAAGRLGPITSHGELDDPDGCFVRIEPGRRIHSYGLGVSLLAVARDPLHNGARTLERP